MKKKTIKAWAIKATPWNGEIEVPAKFIIDGDGCKEIAILETREEARKFAQVKHTNYKKLSVIPVEITLNP